MTATDDLPFDPASVSFEDDEKKESDTPTRTRKRRSDAGVSRGGTGTRGSRSTSTAKLAAELTDPIAKFAVGIAVVSPTAAAVLIARGEATARALVSIAESHPRMLAALKRASKVGPASELAQTGLMLFVAIQLDTGRIQPDNPLASAIGVSDLFRQVTESVDAVPQGQPIPSVHFRPPPGFGPTQPVSMNDPAHPLYSFRAGAGAGSL